MRTNIVRIFIAVLSVCVVINLGYQVYIKLFSPYQTEVVYEYDYNHTFEADGIIFKDEVIIENTENTGIIQYLYTNGSRVATGSSIAKVYQQESDMAVVTQIDNLNQQIDFLKTAQNTSFESDTSLSIINKQLSNNYFDFIKSSESGDFSNLSQQKQSLALALNKRQIFTKEVSDFSNLIQQLEQQKTDLQNSLAVEPREILSEYSGHFVDLIDGYESQMTLEYAQVISQDELASLLNQYQELDTSASALGKIITKPEIIYIALVPTSVVHSLSEGEQYSLTFEDSSQNISAEVISIKADENNEQSLVSFKIKRFTEEIVSLRKSVAEVYLGDYVGLKIPKSALHSLADSETGEEISGVYVVTGVTMSFRKVNIVYESNQYVLVENNANSSDTLQLYDTIIVKGKDLYDGKAY